MHVALLRAINVAGQNLIAMADLREMFADLGFSGAKTLLQSGNVVFNGGRKAPTTLERLLESETTKRFGGKVDYIIRTAAEWGPIIERNPFPAEAVRTPSHCIVMLLRAAPSADAIARLRASIKGPEVIECDGRHLYIAYQAGIGPSKFTNRVIESKLSTRGTARNWNTMLKLASLLKPKDP